MTGGLELVPKLGRALGRLVNRERPPGVDPRASRGTLFASRSKLPLSLGPHHDPGALLMI